MNTDTSRNKERILQMISKEVKATMEQNAQPQGAVKKINKEALLYIRF